MKIINNTSVINVDNAVKILLKAETNEIVVVYSYTDYVVIYQGDNAKEVFEHLTEYIISGKEFFDLR